MSRSLGLPLAAGSTLVLGLGALCVAILIPESSTPSAAAEVASTTSMEPASVVPGGVFEWPGENATGCGAEGASWTPIDGTCWYPVDLLTTAESVAIWRQTNSGRQTRSLEVLDYPYPVQHLTITDDSKVNLSAEDVARARRESARIGKLWSLRTPRRFELPLGQPLADLPEGGRFGARRFMNGQPKNPHSGADYSADTGTPVRAVADGTVVLAEEHFFAGNSVFVDHGDGLISMSFHLDSIQAQVGDEIERGHQIGTVGATGRVTGPHLHFGLRWRGKRVDPEALIDR